MRTSGYLPLTPQEILIWRIDTARDIRPDAMAILAPDERRRATAMTLPDLRRQYVNTRMALRKILGHYLRQPPERVELLYGPHQKPTASMPPGAPPLYFSLTHTRNMALIALATGGVVGIDVEYTHRRLHDLDALIDRALAPAEARAVRARPASDRMVLFLRYWTAKEACLKAAGTGLSHGAAAASITMRTDDRADGTLAPGAHDPGTADVRCPPDTGWQIFFFQPEPDAPDYIGALAVHPAIKHARLTLVPAPP